MHILSADPTAMQALAIEAGEKLLDTNLDDLPSPSGHYDGEHMAFYEITVASADQPKLLSRLSEALVGDSQADPDEHGMRGAMRLKLIISLFCRAT